MIPVTENTRDRLYAEYAKNGRTITKPVAGIYPDILQGDEKFPTELSCAERSVSAPQSIAANLFASTIVASILYQLIICGELVVTKNHILINDDELQKHCYQERGKH